MNRIYLDHAATSPLRPEVREAMLPWLDCGNPSSLYWEGRSARSAIDSAREVLSDALGCLFAEVLFTSSGTEAANMAIFGSALAGMGGRRNRILMSAVEHPCVLETRETLESLGYRVEIVPVDSVARVKVDRLAEMLGEDVLLVCVMHANNEVGTIQPVRTIADLAHATGALFHCDAVQSFGSLPWHVADIDADIVTISGHKIGGPKGVGAIYTRAGVILKPWLVGGGQEREMRAGTENVAAIVGFSEAVRSRASTDSHGSMRAARDAFVRAVNIPAIHWTTPWEGSLPGHAHGRIPGVSAETMLIRLDRAGISASSGAACSSGSLEPSHVLQACGLNEQESKEGLRFTFGPTTTTDEAIRAANILNSLAGAGPAAAD